MCGTYRFVTAAPVRWWYVPNSSLYSPLGDELTGATRDPERFSAPGNGLVGIYSGGA